MLGRQTNMEGWTGEDRFVVAAAAAAAAAAEAVDLDMARRDSG